MYLFIHLYDQQHQSTKWGNSLDLGLFTALWLPAAGGAVWAGPAGLGSGRDLHGVLQRKFHPNPSVRSVGNGISASLLEGEGCYSAIAMLCYARAPPPPSIITHDDAFDTRKMIDQRGICNAYCALRVFL